MFEHTNDEDMGGVHIFLNPKPIYIYIYIKRERERDIYIYIYIYRLSLATLAGQYRAVARVLKFRVVSQVSADKAHVQLQV